MFHSLRRTVATLLEDAGVPEGVAADILVHEKKTLSYGLYRSGSSMQRKIEAIVKVAYPSLCTRKGGRRAQTQEVPYEEARREAIRQASRKYYNTHREAIYARRGERRE